METEIAIIVTVYATRNRADQYTGEGRFIFVVGGIWRNGFSKNMVINH
jgi:hypothetical protein